MSVLPRENRVFIALVFCGFLQASDLPPEVVEVRRARAYRNARITWIIEPGDHGRVPDQFGTHTYAGDDVAYEFHYPDLGPGTPFTDHMVKQGMSWKGSWLENDGDVRRASWYEDARSSHGPHLDFRMLGVDPLPRAPIGRPPALPDKLEPQASYCVSRDGPNVLVTLTRPHGEQQRWKVDPQRGWNVTVSELVVDGTVTSRAVSTLKQFGDGTWYPERVDYFTPAPDGELTRYQTVWVSDFVCNSATIGDRLRPEDVGIDVGTNVIRVSANDTGELHIWDGTGLMPLSEFHAKLVTGEVHMGPRFNAAVEHMRQYGARLRRERKSKPSAWEEYVRDFIVEHRLDEDQTQRAWSIYRQCSEQANRYLDAHKEEFAPLENEPDTHPAKTDPEDVARTEKRRAALKQPIEEIFDRMVDRLESLLRGSQRENATSSRPTQ